MKRLMVVLVGVILASGVFVAPGWGKGLDGAVGSVVAVRGEVKATGPQGERVLAIKSALFESDTIRTGPSGRIQLLFEDDTIVSLGSNSVMEIAKYEWDAGNKTGAMKTKVEEGSFRILGGLITKNSPKNFTTETPAATIGIRGSMYAGSYYNDQLKVVFLGGRAIWVSNRHGQVEIDRPGYGTRATPDAAPEPPAKMDPVEVIVMVDGMQEEGPGGSGGGTGDEGSELSPENAELLDPGTGGFVDTTTADVAAETGLDVTMDTSGDLAADTVAEAAAAYTATADMSGWSQLFFFGLPDGIMPVEVGQAEMMATSVDGVITIGDGTGLPSFAMAPYMPSATYTGWDFWTQGEPVTVPTSLGPIATTRDIAWDNKGEFFVYEINYPGEFVDIDGTDYLYQSLTFGGVPTPVSSLPTTGVDTYWGDVLGECLEPDYWDLDSHVMNETMMAVNWANGKVFGMIFDPETPEEIGGSLGPYPYDLRYYYGDLSGGLPSVQFVTGESWTGMYEEPWTSTGSATFGQFYGSNYQGFGMVAEGEDYRLVDMAYMGDWQAVGGVFREPGMAKASPTGTQSWTGFYIGLSDSLPMSGYTSLVRNYNSSWLNLDLNATTGSVAGALSLQGESLNTLEFGGMDMSAYIDDRQFIAEFIPGTYGDINVKTEGSFLVTAAPWHQFSDYASWGYWNVAYDEWGSDLHIHSPGSFWVAGQQTPAAIIDGLISSEFTATYTGPAYGVGTDLTSMISSPLTNGSTNLTFAFGSGAINGAIGFDQINLQVNGIAAFDAAGSFIADEAIPLDPYSSLTGGFFGPNAEAMAGTFSAKISNVAYSGIFGGNR